MSFPDYGRAVERVGLWIAQDVAGMVPGKTLLLEPTLPTGPDGIQALFEFGGTWNEERGWQDWSLMLVTRAATLLDARKLAMLSIQSALKNFCKSAVNARDGIQDLQLQSLPALRPRDEKGRVILETRFLMRIHAVWDIGLEIDA
jgi:hypothetical protein